MPDRDAAPTASLGDVFDLTLTLAVMALVPNLAFNELPSVTNGSFWVEILNYGDAMESLGGLVLARVRSSTNAEYVLPAQSLPPGATSF